MASLTPFLVGLVMLVDMLLLFLMLVHDMFLMVLVLVLLLDPRETIVFLLVEALAPLLELLFRGRFPRVFQVVLIQTSICIMLTHMIS